MGKIGIECDGEKWHGAEHYKNDMINKFILIIDHIVKDNIVIVAVI